MARGEARQSWTVHGGLVTLVITRAGPLVVLSTVLRDSVAG